jgi:hypothetical protein
MSKARHIVRHPIRSITEPYGKAGLLVAILALVLATTGAAFAAGKLTSKEKTEVKKIVAAEVKKHPGPAGPQGPQGNPGPAGAPGKDGTNGTNGENGKSVVAAAASSGECPQGGTKLEVQGSGTSEHVCNGQTGFTSTLPSERTEMGDWGMIGEAKQEEGIGTGISFVIPLETPLDAGHVHFIRENGKEAFLKEENGEPVGVEERTQPACPGTAAAPEAEAGNLCVYTKRESNSYHQVFFNSSLHFIYPTICPFGTAVNGVVCGESEVNGADIGGFGLYTIAASAGTVEVFGTWAVTAE